MGWINNDVPRSYEANDRMEIKSRGGDWGTWSSGHLDRSGSLSSGVDLSLAP